MRYINFNKYPTGDVFINPKYVVTVTAYTGSDGKSGSMVTFINGEYELLKHTCLNVKRGLEEGN